ATSVFGLSGRDGRFAFRNLPSGPYLLRAHLQGYVPPRGRIVQVGTDSHDSSTIALTRRSDLTDVPVMAAGIGAAGAPEATSGDDETTEDGDEVTWRLRHLRRSVLKDVAP